MAESEEFVSTSALARRLELPVQQLFATLRDYEWIRRHGEQWLLTAKGEFMGGRYQDSRRFGRYIVWPARVAEHPLLAAIESSQRVTASQMRRYFPQLQPRQINRALAELGLQVHTLLGWELTDFGKRLGGQQAESESSGAFYVSWPHELVDHPVIQRELSRLAPQARPLPAPAGGEDDLFADVPEAPSAQECTLDGHTLGSALQRQVCDWLYLAQLAHATGRALPVEEKLVADFYLPQGSVYIDCWDEHASPARMAERLRNQSVCEELGLPYLSIKGEDAERLDEVLLRALLGFGIRC